MARKPNYKYNVVVEQGKPVSITVFYKGEDYIATPGHPNFDLILDAVQRGDNANVLIGLFDTYHSIGQRFKALVNKVKPGKRPRDIGDRERLRRLSSKVTVKNGSIFYEGKQVHGVLADTIAKYVLERNPDMLPLAKFLENIMLNPNEHSREQLYQWLQHFSFKITDEGNFLAYKYVKKDFKSASSGVGIVNGKRVNGQLDNSIGNVVEMPRSKVTHDPRVACSHGLHAGTWQYVKEYGGYGTKTIRVEINPRDVVSVPTDSNGQKLRVCRYKVLEEASSREDSRIYAGQTV